MVLFIFDFAVGPAPAKLPSPWTYFMLDLRCLAIFWWSVLFLFQISVCTPVPVYLVPFLVSLWGKCTSASCQTLLRHLMLFLWLSAFVAWRSTIVAHLCTVCCSRRTGGSFVGIGYGLSPKLLDCTSQATWVHMQAGCTAIHHEYWRMRYFRKFHWFTHDW